MEIMRTESEEAKLTRNPPASTLRHAEKANKNPNTKMIRRFDISMLLVCLPIDPLVKK
jgi:hypothetical protein